MAQRPTIRRPVTRHGPLPAVRISQGPAHSARSVDIHSPVVERGRPQIRGSHQKPNAAADFNVGGDTTQSTDFCGVLLTRCAHAVGMASAVAVAALVLEATNRQDRGDRHGSGCPARAAIL